MKKRSIPAQVQPVVIEEFCIVFDGSDIQIDIYCGVCHYWFGKLIGASIKSTKQIKAMCPNCKQEKPVVFYTASNH